MNNKNLAVFILSKDRVLQFDATIYSLFKNFDIEGEVDVYVLAKSSNDHMRKCYEETCDFYRNAHDSFVMLSHETADFRWEFLNQLDHLAQYDHCLYLTDDTIAFKSCFKSSKTITEYLQWYPEVFTVSLRLGLNTTQQNPEDLTDKIVIPPPNAAFGGYLIWNWRREDRTRNLGYPISMDGHIYRPKQLSYSSQCIAFSNLREWESHLMDYVWDETNNVPSYMGCFDDSYCVNIPMNMVQYPDLLTQGPYGRSIHELQNLYNLGYRIDLEKTFKDMRVVGSHQYIGYKFSQKDECR